METPGVPMSPFLNEPKEKPSNNLNPNLCEYLSYNFQRGWYVLLRVLGVKIGVIFHLIPHFF